MQGTSLIMAVPVGLHGGDCWDVKPNSHMTIYLPQTLHFISEYDYIMAVCSPCIRVD